MSDPLAPPTTLPRSDTPGNAVCASDEHDQTVSEESIATVPILNESIEVQKVAVDRGGYRITKRFESRDVTIDELLRHETVDIERRPVNRELPDGEVPSVRYEGDTMIVPVVKEVIVTHRRLVLVEEIRVARIKGTHRDLQSLTVREEFVEIERLGAETGD